MGDGQLGAVGQQAAHPELEPGEGGKEPAQHPQRQQEEHIVGHEEHIARLAVRRGLVEHAVNEKEQHPCGQHHQAGQGPHLEVVPERPEEQSPAVPPVPPDAAHHRVVEGGGGRPDGKQGDGAHQPEHAEQEEIHQLRGKAPDVVVRVENTFGHAGASFDLRTGPATARRARSGLQQGGDCRLAAHFSSGREAAATDWPTRRAFSSGRVGLILSAISGYSSASTCLHTSRMMSPPRPDMTRPSSSTCLKP